MAQQLGEQKATARSYQNLDVQSLLCKSFDFALNSE